MFKPYKEIKPLNERNIRFVYPDKSILKGKILDEIEIEKPLGIDNKIYKYLFQRIEWDRENDQIELRICYYYKDLDNSRKHWIFGQYALTLTIEDMLYFIEEMKKRKWI